jgi:hypothetical protein
MILQQRSPTRLRLAVPIRLAKYSRRGDVFRLRERKPLPDGSVKNWPKGRLRFRVSFWKQGVRRGGLLRGQSFRGSGYERPSRRNRCWNRGSERNTSKAGRTRIDGLNRAS